MQESDPRRRSLVDLPDELQIQVIDFILERDKEDHARLAEAWRQERLASGSRNLERDDEFEYHSDLINWSSTSFYFRNLLAPYIFKQVKLRNDSKSTMSVNALLRGPHGTLISELYFVGSILDSAGNPDRSYPSSASVGLDFATSSKAAQKMDEDLFNTPVLPASTRDLLSNLSQISNLQSVSIGFSYPYRNLLDDVYYDEDATTVFGRVWRDLISNTYVAFAENKAPGFTRLELRHWVFTHCNPFKSPQLHCLLDKMVSFTISIRGGTNAIRANISREDSYIDAIATLDHLFLNHLQHARSLILKAPETGPIGWHPSSAAPLTLRPHQMPVLQSLDLDYVLICPALLSFASSHALTLESLTLRNCAVNVGPSNPAHPPFYWQDFFAGLAVENPLKLRHLDITPQKRGLLFKDTVVPEGWNGSSEWFDLPEEDTEGMKEARRLLAEEGRDGRCFRYVTPDYKYASIIDDEDEIIAAFQRGKDEETYEELLQTIERNTSTSGQTMALHSR